MTKHFSQKEMATWANVKRSHGSQWGEPSSLKFNCESRRLVNLPRACPVFTVWRR